MTRYIGADYHYDGYTTLTLNSTNITHHKAHTGAAYNYAIVKDASNTTKYIHNIYISHPTVVTSINISTMQPVSTVVGYHWHPIQKGYMFGPYGPLQFWDRPKGIKGLLNVALLKSQPHTMAVALYNNNYTKADIIIVSPTGLADLATPMKIHIAGWGAYGDGKIVIGGLDTSGRFALWDCNNEDYRFDKIWTNDVTYTTNATNIFMSSNWQYGYESYSSPGNSSSYWRFTTVNAFIGNGDQGHTEGKMVSYIYDADVDTYYWNVPYYDKVCYPWNVSGCSNFTSGGGALQNFFRWQLPSSYIYGADREYNNRILGGAQFYVNRALGSINELFISCTHTPSGGNTTGYTFVSTDYGATWTTKYYGDNCYRICRNNPMGGIWAIGYSNANYFRSLMNPYSTGYYSSKVTFPTSVSGSMRVDIPGDRLILKNSSTVYTVDYNKMASGTDQTVGTTTLTDENGNAFAAKDICWNANRCDGNMAFKRSHTFYNSTADNGTLLSETWAGSQGIFYKETINLGGPVLLMTNNGG